MPRAEFSSFDGGILSEFYVENGHLVRRETQPTEDLVLADNQRLQRGEGARNLSWAGCELRIPELHMRRLVKKYPELLSPNAATKTAAWKKFLRSSESAPYRVRHRPRRWSGHGTHIPPNIKAR